jgi:HTH-type transcriptional regulator/antitoxin HigA
MSTAFDQPGSSLGYDPDHAVPAGATLRDLLARQDMTQSELANRIDVSLKHVNQIIHGVAPITAVTALALEKVTRVPAAIWNRLESNYRDRLARLEDRRSQAADSQWLQSLPLKELQDRGFLTPGLRGGARVDEVCRFFGVANRQGWERVWRAPLASFRRSKAFASDVGAVAAWLRIGEMRAAEAQCAPYDAKAFRKALNELRELTRDDPESFAREIVRRCAACGVAVVFVREIPGTRASGAARWPNPTKGLIQLSLRYKTDDHLWFSFFHEAAHLLLHSKKMTFVSGSGSQDEELEQEANDFSASLLIPKRFDVEMRGLRSLPEIEIFASRISIAPGIVVGRLQNEGRLDWSRGNKLKRRLELVEG